MDKLLVWLQERIKLWTKPVTSSLAVGIHSDLARSRADLVVENALLRQQLIILKRQVKRPKLTNADRIHLILLAHFTKFWKQTIHIIQPDTLLSWHRNLFHNHWRRKSQGRLRVESETITLSKMILHKYSAYVINLTVVVDCDNLKLQAL